MKFSFTSQILTAALFVSPNYAAITLDVSSQSSIKSAAQTLASSLMNTYVGNKPGGIPGILPGPYYWWEAGAMFGGLVDYYYLTGDPQFNDIVMQALQFQVGPFNDYMPPNQTKDEGNDDQAFWGMAALSAAEGNFPNPPANQPQWLALAQAVFNDLAHNWDPSTCGGGLKWQIYNFNSGYNYKNTISTACLFNMGARLGRYTGNTTYLDWANKSWDWLTAIGLISSDYHVYDGSDSLINCTQVNHLEWSYNQGAAIHGVATMWNVTKDPIWQTRLNGLLATTTEVFFPNGVMKEVACEDNNSCDTDQQSFKAYLSRWLGHATKLAPFAATTINNLIVPSTKGAVGTCTGGADGKQCGLRWGQAFDGVVGVGEQLSVMEIVQANLQPFVSGPVTANTGGNSTGNPGGGESTTGAKMGVLFSPITTGDKAGAGILTAVVLVSWFCGVWWLSI